MKCAKYHIKTWGCQMNVYDSQRIGEILQELKYEETQDLSEADVVILNTCHIREKATEKVYSDIGRLSVLKKRRQQIGKSLIIAVSGCVAQAEGEEIMKRAPVVDMVFGPQTWHRLKYMLKQLEKKRRVCDTDFPVEEKFDNLPEAFDSNRVKGGSAFVAIQEGCDKFCTYCVVPYTRGAEYSRPTWQVITEVEQLVAAGAKEITLLGQNVNVYHGLSHEGTQWTLGRLIRRLAEIEGLSRIRYTTSYPSEVDEDLISAHQDVDKLMPFLHLPVQSGSDSILKKMNRRHNSSEYLILIDKLLDANPNLKFSSDFIVGFPGETDQDFEDTLQLVKQVNFIQSYSFIFSPRPGTPAAVMDNQIENSVAKDRLYELQRLLNQCQADFNSQSVGRLYNVLLDRTGKREGQLVGKSPYMQAVHLDNANSYLGEIVNLRIVAHSTNSLSGELIRS